MIVTPPIGLMAPKVPVPTTKAAFFAYDTAGYANRLEISNPSSGMRFGAPNDITMEMWIYPLAFEEAGIRQIMVGRKNVSTLGYGLGTASAGSQIYFTYARTGGGTTRHHDQPHGQGSLLNKWSHLSITRETASGTTRFFYNGVEVAAPLVQDPGEFNDLVAGDSVIGASGNASNGYLNNFHGYMAEVRVWSVLRTPAELLANYNQPLVGNEAGLVCYLPLATDFNDLTANSNNFTAIAGDSAPAPSLKSIARPF